MDESPYVLVSPLIEAYAEAHTTDEPEVLARLRRDTHLRTHMPQMLSGHLQGMLLRMLSQMIRPGMILEIGTFTGYSAICLAAGLMPTGKLHTIEINPEMVEFASGYINEAGLKSQVIMHTGDAMEIIPTLPGPFDIVFIDANKENYTRYFDLIIDKIRPGGWLIADNTLWYGRVLDKDAENDKETAGIVAFNKYVHSHPAVENLLLPVRDGLMVIRKKE
ncbi:MAG: O-methyltransferase [Bacteroidetes bacterium]|nr:O-methyltransferase [Bacteroidota bacterium]